MSTLQVSLIADLGKEVNALGVAVPLELIDRSSRIVRRTTIRFPGPLDLPVDPGWYLVCAHLPSGERVAQSTYVRESDDQPVSVKLISSTSQHEWLAWPHFLGSEPIILGAASELSTSTRVRGTRTVSFPRARLWRAFLHLQSPTPHLSWEREDEAFMPMDQFFSQRYILRGRTADTVSFTLDFSNARQSLFMLQIEDARRFSHFIALPPTSGKVQLTVSALAAEERAARGAFAIQVMSQIPAVEMLLRYLRTGAYHQACLIDGDVLPSSRSPERTQHEGWASPLDEGIDLPDPMYAIVGGYYLLRVGGLKQFVNWLEHYVNRFTWIPDKAIIDAWQLLQHAVGDDDLVLAKKLLIEAADLGVTIYTDGVRRLLDGLEMFARQAQDSKFFDPAVTSALAKIRNYANAMDWRQQLTTFTGDEPMRPSLLPTKEAAAKVRMNGMRKFMPNVFWNENQIA